MRKPKALLEKCDKHSSMNPQMMWIDQSNKFSLKKSLNDVMIIGHLESFWTHLKSQKLFLECSMNELWRCSSMGLSITQAEESQKFQSNQCYSNLPASHNEDISFVTSLVPLRLSSQWKTFERFPKGWFRLVAIERNLHKISIHLFIVYEKEWEALHLPWLRNVIWKKLRLTKFDS